MESVAKIEQKKAVEPKFILNRFNGLFKSNQEVTKALEGGASEILACDPQDIRKEQLRLYKEFTNNVLGSDLPNNPEKDPFYQVTGVPIERVYLEKHELIETKERESILSATTLLLSGNYFLEQDTLGVHDNNFGGSVRTDKDFENGDQFKFDLFDPIVINKDREWLMQFGFSSFLKPKSSNLDIGEGTVVLEPGVLELLSKSPESENIAKKLQEILTWFNHDLVAHGTFLPRLEVDRKILESKGNQKLMEVFNNSSLIKEHAFGSAFAGELWSLNLHESVFQKIVAEKPAVVRFLRAHLDSYIRSVENATIDISDKKLSNDVKEYMLKVYAFGFFRLINPKDFDTKPEFSDLKNKYPQLADLGLEEDKAREFTFGEPGLVTYENGKKGYIPHSEVFSEFVGSFEGTKYFETLLKNLGNSLSGENELLDSERKYLRSILKAYHGRSLADLIVDKFGVEMRPLFGSHWEQGSFLEKHKATTLSVLLDETTTKFNFPKKLKKAVYGFMEPLVDRKVKNQNNQRWNR